MNCILTLPYCDHQAFWHVTRACGKQRQMRQWRRGAAARRQGPLLQTVADFRAQPLLSRAPSLATGLNASLLHRGTVPPQSHLLQYYPSCTAAGETLPSVLVLFPLVQVVTSHSYEKSEESLKVTASTIEPTVIRKLLGAPWFHCGIITDSGEPQSLSTGLAEPLVHSKRLISIHLNKPPPHHILLPYHS